MSWRISILGLIVFAISGCVSTVLDGDGKPQGKEVDTVKLSNTYVDLAVEYQQRGAVQVALDRVNLAIRTDKNNARAYMTRAMLYHQLNDDALADVDFQHTLKLKSNYTEAKINYATFLCDRGKYAEANKYFAPALADHNYYLPELVYYHRGNCNYLQAKYKEAEDDFLLSLQGRSPILRANLSLAKLYYQQKNYTLAKSYLDKFNGNLNAADLDLKIQILSGLISKENNINLKKRYTDDKDVAINSLLRGYPDSSEAKFYLHNTADVDHLVKIKQNIPMNDNLIRPPHYKAKLKIEQSQPNKQIATRDKSRTYVVVRAGDTLYSIARNNSLTQEQVMQYNGLTSTKILIGSKLYLEP